MHLLASATSPYARKLRILAHELGLDMPMHEAAPLDDDPDFLAANPLGKVPVLILDNGEAIFDSPVIAGYLLDLAPNNPLLPTAGPDHWHGRTTEAIADGILDAAIILRFNAGQGVTTGMWVDRQFRAIDRALAALATRTGTTIDLAAISTVVALEYLDFRWPAIDWRSAHPGLAALQARLTDRASLASTRPPV